MPKRRSGFFEKIVRNHTESEIHDTADHPPSPLNTSTGLPDEGKAVISSSVTE